MGRTQNMLNVLGNGKYLLTAVATAGISFFALHFLMLSNVADYSIVVYFQMSGFWFSLLSLLSNAFIAVLFGINLALMLFVFGQSKKLGVCAGSGNFAGIISGAFASGCPMCGSLLFALVGEPLALFFMPFGGLELKAVSIVLLAASIYFLSADMKKCKVTAGQSKQGLA
ncbi:MAG: hypothetical protein HYW05_02925 [Candidatus Diapherotrites archaeon]|nr:hypothetical protein [Candidatus Diapherotrites archaeon]